MAVEIREVITVRDLTKFIRFGIDMYKNCEYAAPPLEMDDKLNLTKGKNPALEFCETAYYLAYKNGEIVGRIACIINPVANETWNHKHARFGWIDFIDDYEVSRALFDTAANWAHTKGMNGLQGPLGFTDFDKEGLLIEGFDRKSTLATIYNYPYYPQHFEKYGFEKEADWKEYLITVPEVFPEKYSRIADIVRQKYQLKTVKAKSRKEIVNRYGVKIFDLLNLCYKDLFGFTILNQKQIDFYIKLYFSFVQLDIISLVVDKDDNVVALGIAMPSFTKALQKSKGKLFPLGWYYMLRSFRKNEIIDLYLIATHPDYQSKGAISLVFVDIMKGAAKHGYKFAESNPELETNVKVASQWGSFEHINHKRRRVFFKKI